MKLRAPLLTFLAAILLLTSCMQAANNRLSVDGEDSEQESTNNIIENPTDASWYAKNQYIQGPITINSTDTESIYLVGGVVNNSIVSSEKVNSAFCLVADFDGAGEVVSGSVVKKPQVRLKAIPIKSSKSQEVSMRIEIANAIDSQAFCGDGIIGYTGSTTHTTYLNNKISGSLAAYSLNDVCPTCNSSFPALNLRFHESVYGTVNSVPTLGSIGIDNLNLNIDVKNTTTNPDTNSCTNSSCQLQGYNCCLNGQCVNDGATRPNIDEDSLEYQTALNEMLENPNAFKSYPNLFYVCPINTDPSEDDETDTEDELDNANQQLQADIKDYKCLLGETAECSPDLDSVRVKIWEKCGCPHEPTYAGGELQLDARCIDYGLKADKDANGNILNITCDIPVNENDDAPFQNLSVLVSAKSAPHRFFSLAGVPYDNLSEVPEGTNQEGDYFFYLDDANKAGPIETTYSMNAVLGPMTLDLQQAQPAKVVEVDVDQVYIISATSGYSTPCPYCQQDAWQKVLSSHPESSKGYGLTWRGYTTDRTAIGSNTTFGNYEDTIFGRACWVPPTMLASSHISYSNAGVQRRNRLTTQAAMYVNGYQRDWYGFNQGALIGSFDGVSWFAVGAGRRVRSTTNKLFLAINAPFADLTQNSNFTVSVVEDLGGQTAADHDYDFSLDPDSAAQNFGASCQYMHSCNTDSDCVAKLGWEYACGQITDVKTNWPKFDIDAFEKNDYSREAISLSAILAGNISGGQNNRCVYRGAGSPCKLNPNENVKKTSQSKLLTCAPNFYCAALDSASFSKELIRSPNEPTSILFGQAASILGRPISYTNRADELPQEVQNAIAQNLSIYAATGSYEPSEVGLCIPGRSADTGNTGVEAFELRHEKQDNDNRTDYISQIAACDETAYQTGKVRSCPVFDEDGNYLNDETPIRNPLAVRQNMCSASSIDPVTTESTFKSIEAGNLSYVLNVQSETLAANACLRRAGAICHTDLDCGPNRLHADVARGLSPSSFGGTMAEQKFWEEELVCGQSQEEPLLNTILGANYYNYDMSKNRCCREVSKTFTMYTAVGARSDLPGYNVDNVALNPLRDSISDNDKTGRYSRYLAAESYSTNPSIPSFGLPSANDTKVINETGRANCCGGGFIRKFEDGTNNWTVGNRLNISPSKLACLNYSMRSWEKGFDPTNQNNWLMEYSYMSSLGGYRTYPDSPTNLFDWLRPGDPVGAVQANIQNDSETPQAPTEIPATGLSGRISLSPVDAEGQISLAAKTVYGMYEQLGVSDTYNAPYPPVILKPSGFNNPQAPLVSAPSSDNGFAPDNLYLAIYIPDYVDITSIRNVLLHYTDDADAADFSDINFSSDMLRGPPSAIAPAPENYGDEVTCSSVSTAANDLLYTDSNDIDSDGNTGEPSYCIIQDNFNYLFFYVGNQATLNGFQKGWFSFEYDLKDEIFGTIPGNQAYYEDIFEKYELLGVPQVAYEAIRCNDEKANPADGTSNVGRLIEGVYNDAGPDPFTADAIPGTPAGVESKVYYKTDGSTISLPQIFSADEFKCCSKLGSNVTDPSNMCCSGFGVLNSDNTYECRLPSGTDLNLYLNLFISSEGIVTDDENMSLTPDETHYNLETGYPDHSSETVRSKIQQIGERFCQLGTVSNGSAFDNFYPQPAAGYFTEDTQLTSYNTIVDSMDDLTATSANYTEFISGKRWNRHFYCD